MIAYFIYLYFLRFVYSYQSDFLHFVMTTRHSVGYQDFNKSKITKCTLQQNKIEDVLTN